MAKLYWLIPDSPRPPQDVFWELNRHFDLTLSCGAESRNQTETTLTLLERAGELGKNDPGLPNRIEAIRRDGVHVIVCRNAGDEEDGLVRVFVGGGGRVEFEFGAGVHHTKRRKLVETVGAALAYAVEIFDDPNA